MDFKGGIFILFQILLLCMTQSKSWQVGSYVPPFHDIENQPSMKDNLILNIPIPSDPPKKHEGLTDNEEDQLLSVLPKKYETIGNYSVVESLVNKIKDENSPYVSENFNHKLSDFFVEPIKKYPPNIRPENNNTWNLLSNNNDNSKQTHLNHSKNNDIINKMKNNINPETVILQQILEILNSKQNVFASDNEQQKRINEISNLNIPILSESSEKKEGFIEIKELEPLSVLPKNHDAVKNVSLIENLTSPFKEENLQYTAENMNNRILNSFIKPLKTFSQNISRLNETENLLSSNNTDIERMHLNPNNKNNEINIKFSNTKSGSDILTELLELINSRQNSLVDQDSGINSKLNITQSHELDGEDKPNEKSLKHFIGNKPGTLAQNLEIFIETATTTEKSDIIENNTEYLNDSKQKKLNVSQNKVKARQNQDQRVNLDYLEEITKLFNQQNALSHKNHKLNQPKDPNSLKRIKDFFVRSENGDGSNESVDLDRAIKSEPKSLKMLVDLLRIPKENDHNRLNVERKREPQNQQLFASSSNYNNYQKSNLEKIQRLYSTLQQRKKIENSYFNKLRHINQMYAMRNSPLLSPLNAVSALQAHLLFPQNFTYPNTYHFGRYQMPSREAYFKQPNNSQQISADQQTSEDFLDDLSNLNVSKDFRGSVSHPSYECELGSIWRIGCHRCICSPQRKFLCVRKPYCNLSDEIKADNASSDEIVISSIFP